MNGNHSRPDADVCTPSSFTTADTGPVRSISVLVRRDVKVSVVVDAISVAAPATRLQFMHRLSNNCLPFFAT